MQQQEIEIKGETEGSDKGEEEEFSGELWLGEWATVSKK